MPGQLPRPRVLPLATLDALLAQTLPLPTAAPPLRLAARIYLAVQALFLLIVRVADGEAAFLEGAVARGLSVTLLLLALPVALGAARAGGALVDDGVVALAELRGVPREVVERRSLFAPLRIALRDVGLSLLVLGGGAMALSLGDGPLAFARRLGVVLLLGVAALVGASALVGLGVGLGKLARGERAPWFLGAALVGPWLLVSLADAPRELSLPGLYRSLVELLLSLAA